ncbi:MAG: hypothetical protein QNL62_08980 [Gammaproteobacteria bacterium]|nr:hypothetical protein [Gammaproteobacteria bacterium]
MKNKNLKKQTFVVYLASAFIIFSSLYICHILQNWQWFSRAGSLIVVLGIYLTSSQIIENSRRLRQRYSSTHKEGNFQRDWANGKLEQILRHARVHEEETWVMGKCGFNLLIAGTLIWGFGDLLFLLF